jgi:hypothetical protein
MAMAVPDIRQDTAICQEMTYAQISFDHQSMFDNFKICLWQNFGAAVDMLGNAIAACPKDMWEKDMKFFYLSYHTVIFLDYYLSIPVSEFSPQLPYFLENQEKLPEQAVDDVLPLRHFDQGEMLAYIAQIKEKCRDQILNFPEERLSQPWIKASELELHVGCPKTVVTYSVLEILFYNLRHVQHHVGQLNLILRRQTNQAPDWVAMVD